jgi:hypothetical protein
MIGFCAAKSAKFGGLAVRELVSGAKGRVRRRLRVALAEGVAVAVDVEIEDAVDVDDAVVVAGSLRLHAPSAVTDNVTMKLGVSALRMGASLARVEERGMALMGSWGIAAGNSDLTEKASRPSA